MIGHSNFILAMGAFVVSLLLTGCVLKLARRHALLDHPNDRSSHSVATPRGGGLGIVLTIAVGGLLICVGNNDYAMPLAIVLLPAAVIAALGLVDDRVGLSAGLRLLVQFACALAVLGAAVTYLQLALSGSMVAWLFVLAFAIVWCTNLYNFMDGIDGLAGAEAVFVGISAAALLGGRGNNGIASLLWVVAGACAGFLVWNRSPARIFMGDVGSASLGFLFAALAAYTSLSGLLSEWVWLLLLGVFVVDATVTLIVRWRRRERLAQAHRSHAYQRLSRRFGRHTVVVVAVMAVNVGWLLPWAMATRSRPESTLWFVLVALVPLGWAALRLGAGRPDDAS